MLFWEREKPENTKMKRLKTNLMAAAIAVGLIAFLGCDAVKEDPDAAKKAAEEEVDDSDAENPEKIDMKKEPKISAKKDKGPGDDVPPDENPPDEE